MTNNHQFDSLVNKVEIIETSSSKRSNVVVRKKFNSFALGTKVNLPSERYGIEANISCFLQSYLSDNKYIKTPRLLDINENDSELYYEYINATTLYEYIHHNNLPIGHIKELMSLLRQIELTELSTASKLFDKFGPISKICREAQIAYKFKEDPICMESVVYDQLCLGDVSLTNVLFDGKYLYLIDFEFSRMFYGNYDRSQILGQIKSIYSAKDFFELNEECNKLNNDYWLEKFYNYYKRKYGAS